VADSDHSFQQECVQENQARLPNHFQWRKTRVRLLTFDRITGGAPLLALFEKGPSNSRHRSAPRLARQESAPGRRFISSRFFYHISTVTAVIGIPIAIPENEDRIGSARSMRRMEPERTTSTAKFSLDISDYVSIA